MAGDLLKELTIFLRHPRSVLVGFHVFLYSWKLCHVLGDLVQILAVHEWVSHTSLLSNKIKKHDDMGDFKINYTHISEHEFIILSLTVIHILQLWKNSLSDSHLVQLSQFIQSMVEALEGELPNYLNRFLETSLHQDLSPVPTEEILVVLESDGEADGDAFANYFLGGWII